MRLVTKAGLHDGIIRAGVQLGAELGEEGLTMRAIAAQLGISVTNIYQHFENKAAILREIRFLGVALLNQVLIDAAEAHEASESATRLHDMAHAYIRFARSNQWLYKLLTDAEGLDWSDMPDDERSVALGPIATTHATFAAGVASASFRADLDVAQAVLLTWASLHGIASLLLSGRLPGAREGAPVADTEAFVDAFVVNLVAGFLR